MRSFRVLVINPGSTSTKVAVYEGDGCVLAETLPHPAAELLQFSRVVDQYGYRMESIMRLLEQRGLADRPFDAIVGRGGTLKPLPGGTYLVNAKMVEDLLSTTIADHASNLGGVISYNLGRRWGIPSYIVDPVCVDEMEPLARISGLPLLERRSLSHALNMKAVARKVAADMGKRYEELNLIVVHLGGGISVSAHRRGRMVDVNNANEEGPFSPERCGTLPCTQLARLCFSGKFTAKEMDNLLTKKGGVYAYLGTKDMQEVEQRVAAGDEAAALVLEAMSYQVAKEIGGMATVLQGDVDAIVITGGLACSDRITGSVRQRVSFIAPVTVVPGEREMEALAQGALRVLRGEEDPQEYS